MYQKELMLEGKEVTISTFKNKWLGIVGDQRMVLEIFKDHNERVEKLVGKYFADGTLERYKTALAHTNTLTHLPNRKSLLARFINLQKAIFI